MKTLSRGTASLLSRWRRALLFRCASWGIFCEKSSSPLENLLLGGLSAWKLKRFLEFFFSTVKTFRNRPQFCYFKVQNSFIFYPPSKVGTVGIPPQKRVSRWADFLRKREFGFFFLWFFGLRDMNLSLLLHSWCIISMSIFFDAAEKWKKSKSWIEDSKAAAAALVIIMVEGHRNLSIASFRYFAELLTLLINSPVTLPNSANFLGLAKNTFRKSCFKAENCSHSFNTMIKVEFSRFSMQFQKYLLGSRAGNFDEITG